MQSLLEPLLAIEHVKHFFLSDTERMVASYNGGWRDTYKYM